VIRFPPRVEQQQGFGFPQGPQRFDAGPGPRAPPAPVGAFGQPGGWQAPPQNGQDGFQLLEAMVNNRNQANQAQFGNQWAPGPQFPPQGQALHQWMADEDDDDDDGVVE